MKTLTHCITICCALLVACSSDSLVGSGSVTTQSRSVSSFAAIDVNGPVTTVVTAGTTPSITVEADDNVIDRVTTRVGPNGVLSVGMDPGGYSNFTATIRIVTPAISSIATRGSGSTSLEQGTTSATFILDNYGSGPLTVSGLAAVSLTSNLHGSGSITLSGSVGTLNIRNSGSANVNAFDCTSQSARVAIFGSGSCQVDVNTLLVADIFGSGNIVYEGDPEVRTSGTGSGSVERRS